MATGNIDCNIPDALFSYSQPFNLNLYTHGVQECDDEESEFMMESTQSNVRNSVFSSAHTIEDFASKIIMDHAQSNILDSNENPTNTLPVLCVNGAPSNTSENNIDNNENSVPNEEIVTNPNFPLSFNLPKAMPDELFINVDSDDEGVHSWRPNITSDTLCSDFFMMTDIFRTDSAIKLPTSTISDKVEYYKDVHESFKLTSNAENSIVGQEIPRQPAQSTPRIDIESHMQDQMAGLNIVKYEIINARIKANELRKEMTNLEHKLNERLNIQKTFDVEKLKSENSQLRVECHCLFMEVDYYERDSLGKTDEKSQQEKQISTKDEARDCPSNQNNDNDDQEDNQKWDCHKCTFSNHPLINCCEMCQTQRLSAESLSPYLVPSHDSCFCHPKTESS